MDVVFFVKNLSSDKQFQEFQSLYILMLEYLILNYSCKRAPYVLCYEYDPLQINLLAIAMIVYLDKQFYLLAIIVSLTR